VKEKEHWEYDVKCRKCGKITRMFFSDCKQISAKDFKIWVSEHSTFPIQRQCDCDNGMVMLHDIVAFGNALLLEVQS